MFRNSLAWQLSDQRRQRSGRWIERSARPTAFGKGQITDMEIYFPGGKRVYADYGGFTIRRDQLARSGGTVKKHLRQSPSLVITTVTG